MEVKGIYAGLVMVEAKCSGINERQNATAQEKGVYGRFDLKNDQWQSLIALHKQLLHEHHDFFLASQHPSASPALSRLAAKYSMPARMWRHGIHAFLEVLRHRLPDSTEHMLAFIYIAYSMVALLYETVPAFEDTWIECLGDLGRYRMAIKDYEPKDREVWSNVAKFWYNKAPDKSPCFGRLYHPLAILARPYSLEQLSLYTRSLSFIVPLSRARGSVVDLFNSALGGKSAPSPSLETMFIRTHALLFTLRSKPMDRLEAASSELEGSQHLKKYIPRSDLRFKNSGVYLAAYNIAALFENGTKNDGLPVLSSRRTFDRMLADRSLSLVDSPAFDIGHNLARSLDAKSSVHGLQFDNLEDVDNGGSSLSHKAGVMANKNRQEACGSNRVSSFRQFLSLVVDAFRSVSGGLYTIASY